MTGKIKLLTGIFGAASAGVVVGLLVAPKRGKVMRKFIKKKTNDLTDSLKDQYEKGKEKLDDLKEKGRHIISVAEEKVNDIKDRLI